MHLTDADLEKLDAKTVKELLILYKHDKNNEV
jgi:hypothetical protein